MRFAFKTSPQNTTWPDMLAVWKEADDIELFESGWTFDHFYPIFSDSAGPCLEGWMTLAALAQATRRLRLGTLVTGIHYRHPAVLANMAATLDIVSGGRLELGIGAGWNEEESGAYGIELGSPAERSDRFEEACEVIVSLLTRQTTDFAGRYYQLTDARCEPKAGAAAAPAGVHRRQRRAAHAAHRRAVRAALELRRRHRPRSSRASATCCTRTARTSAATPRRSCCPATSGWAPTARPDRPSTPWPRSANRAWTWRSSFSRRRTTPPCWPRSPRRSPSSADTDSPAWPQATGITLRPADILDDMDSRASDKIPGARVRVKRHPPAQPSSNARPREWLALADGAVQEARTEGPVLPSSESHCRTSQVVPSGVAVCLPRS